MVVTSYPFLFSFRDLIAGNGYFANVAVRGRVLLVEEDDHDWWLFGVQPGCVAGGAAERSVALTEFKKNYMSVLIDIAAEAPTYETFAAQVKSLFSQVNEPNAAEWAGALEHLRSGSLKYPGVVSVKAADANEPSIEVTLVRTATPDLNADVELEYEKAA